MKLDHSYILRTIAGKDCLLPTGQMVIDTDKIILVNGTAAFLLRCLSEESTKEELFAAMCREYGPENDDELLLLKTDLEDFLTNAKAEGLLEE